YNYGRSMIGLQLLLFFREGNAQGLKSLLGLLNYDRDRLSFLLKRKGKFFYSWLSLIIGGRKGLLYIPYNGRERFPIELAWAETKGHLAGAFTLLRSLLVTRFRLSGYNSKMFARRRQQRQPIRPVQPELGQLSQVK